MTQSLKGLRLAPLALAASLVVSAAHAETLMLYTSQPEADASKTVEEFRKVNPGIEVQVYRSGTSDILSKLAAEFAAGAPIAPPSACSNSAAMYSGAWQSEILR